MRSTSANFVRVAVLGAAGGIGQPLSMLLKSSPLVSELSLYDVRGAPGVAADLSHVCTPAKVSGYGTEDLHRALDGAQLVLIPAGVPRKPGMTRDDLFGTNAGIIRDLAAAVAKSAPKAIVAVIANPLNSLVPVAAATLEKAGVYDPARLMGITTLDLVRGRTFIAEALGKSPYDIQVPVIGGHSGQTIVPILAQYRQLTQEQVEKITYRIQFGGDEVIKAKAGSGSATLAMAYAGAEFVTLVMKALNGEAGIRVTAMVESPLQLPRCRFFSSEVVLGRCGVSHVLKLPKLNAFEKHLLDRCVPDLEKNIRKGLTFVLKG